MGTIAVLLSAPDERILARLSALDDLTHLAAPSHEWEWAKPLEAAGFVIEPIDIDRQSLPFGYSETEFEAADEHARLAVNALHAQLPEALDKIVVDFTPVLRRWLKQLLGRRFRFALVLQRWARQHDPDAVLLLDTNSGSSTDLRDGLIASGFNAELFPPANAPAQPNSPDHWRDDLTKQVNKLRRALPASSSGKGRYAVFADLRNIKEFRHRGTALQLINQLARHQKVSLYQPITKWQFDVTPAFLSAHWNALGRMRLNRTFNPSKLRLKQPGSWTQVLTNAACADDDPKSPLLPAKQRVLSNLLGLELPGWLACADNLSRQFASNPPKAAIAVPGHHPFAMLGCQAAQLNNIPAFDIHTLLQTQSARLAEPIAHNLATLDDLQAKMFTDRFPDLPLNLKSFGPPDLAAWADAINTRPATPIAAGKRTIMLPTQPIWQTSEKAIKICLQALQHLPNHQLLISMHPDEGKLSEARYRRAAEASPCADRVTISRQTVTPQMMSQIEVMLTICSNVGYKAALGGMPTIAIILDQSDSLRFDKMGIAMGAPDAKALLSCLQDIEAENGLYSAWQTSRQKFLQQQNWAQNNETVAEICHWIAATVENRNQGGA